jgi:hypothetical protein
VRVWWQEVFIESMGGLLGTIAAAGVVAVAGRAAGLFDAASDVDFRRFLEVAAGALALIIVVLGMIAALAQLFFG